MSVQVITFLRRLQCYPLTWILRTETKYSIIMGNNQIDIPSVASKRVHATKKKYSNWVKA